MTKPENLGAEILKQLQLYNQGVAEGIEVAKQETAKALQKILKSNSPKDTGAYRKGWRIKRRGNKFIVHNATQYQLTHLLEHGHAKRGGGRVPARVHIAPAEERAIKDYLAKVEKVIKP